MNRRQNFKGLGTGRLKFAGGVGVSIENQAVRIANFRNPCENSCETRMTYENALRNFTV